MNPMFHKARFITTHNPNDAVSPVFKKEFEIDKRITKASLLITAQGIYEAHINGTRVGNFIFAPGWTNYKKRLQVQEYDVTDQVVLGNNELSIVVGNGWYFGTIQRGTYDKMAVRAVIASLRLVFEDGSCVEIDTDKSWQYAKTGILYSDLYNGEVFDANVEWVDWQEAVECDGQRETMIPQEGEIVCETQEIPAVKLIKTPKGERVIDFGQEITGYVRFRTVGALGERITLDCAEMLDKDGNFYNENYREAKSQIIYIANGDQTKWFKPTFSFQGFRYIRLTSYPSETIDLKDFVGVVLHSDLKRTGHFVCSNPLVNRLYENVIWGQRGNFLDVPTDCPQRDERLGWTGDAQVFCRTAAYNYDVERFFTKWLRDVASEQFENGAVPEIVPRIWGGTPHGPYAWGDIATVGPWEMYMAYGNVKILEEQFDSMKKWVDFVRNKGDSPAAWGSGVQYGDWLGLDAEEGSYDGATDKIMLSVVFLAYSTDILIKAGKVLNRDMAEYESFLLHVKDVFAKTYIGDDGMLIYDTQTAYVVSLIFDLAPDKAKYAAHLAEKIHNNGDRLQTGFIGTAYIMDALTQNGYADVAYTLLLQEEFPSWLYSVRKGATTIWEHWDGLKPDGSMWSKDMNSFNHYAYGAVASWLYGTVAGIRYDEKAPGYRNVIIQPVPDARLDWAKATLDTRFGTVESGWEKSENGYTVRVSIPSQVTADIVLNGKTIRVSEGSYTYHMD